MPLDGIFLNSIKNELYDKLINGRVDKIYQPDKDEIVMTIRGQGENHKLLMTNISSCPRIHLTHTTRKNPDQPPMFCMLLRKHLTGAVIRDIRQINFDRIIEIVFECKDELQTTVSKSIVIEIMGKHSNIIFFNTESKIIIDAIKRVAENVSSLRQVYPGLKYILPPLPEKLHPIKIAQSKEAFDSALHSANAGMRVYDFVYKTFTGLSPFIAKEICLRAELNEGTCIGELSEYDAVRFFDSFAETMASAEKANPSFDIYTDESNKIYDFYCFNIYSLSNCSKQHFDTSGELLDTYYYLADNKNRINQKVSSLLKSITTKLDRDKKKVDKQRAELLSAEDREKYRIYGELLKANLHMKPEDNKLKVINYYDEEQKEITIPLDPKLNLSQNSQKFFKRYQKLKKAEDELQNLIEDGVREIEYLENILFSIEQCDTADDLDEIYTELVNEGFLKRRKAVKKQKSKAPDILTYISSKGHEILVGRNNLQNELLTFKIGKREDWWFHSKNVPGSHVIVRTNGDELSDEEFEEAASVAAYYSKSKNSSSVEIDYTRKSNVKKPPNAKPGFVIYYTNYSMMAHPGLERVIAKNEK